MAVKLRKLHVAVLMGGWASERPVSLMSGTGVADALESRGHRVTRTGDPRDLVAVDDHHTAGDRSSGPVDNGGKAKRFRLCLGGDGHKEQCARELAESSHAANIARGRPIV